MLSLCKKWKSAKVIKETLLFTKKGHVDQYHRRRKTAICMTNELWSRKNICNINSDEKNYFDYFIIESEAKVNHFLSKLILNNVKLYESSKNIYLDEINF